MIANIALAFLSFSLLTSARSQQATLAGDLNTVPFHQSVPVLPSLADLLTVHPAGSIWYDYAREVGSISKRLSDTSSFSKSTLLVPINKAVLALHRKPHQGPETDEVEITDERTRLNVERWVSAHIIPTAPIDLSSDVPHATLLEGHPVSFSAVVASGGGWERYLVNHSIHILDRAQASNGDIYFIDGVLSV